MPSPTTAPVRAGAYTTSLAADEAEIRAAQRLRYEVFTQEVGAPPPGAGTGLDTDEFDAHCDHLLVRYEPTGETVGTYRLLPPGRTEWLYSDSEFDLAALDTLRPGLVEAGRSCVHPAHRGGEVIGQMWSALARYTLLGGYRYLAGCASVPLADGGHAATQAWRLAQRWHLSPQRHRVRPLLPWTPGDDDGTRPSYAQLPPLLRGYLRLGAWVCGPPAHDPEFGVADFYTVLPFEQVSPRYLRYFLGEGR